MIILDHYHPPHCVNFTSKSLSFHIVSPLLLCSSLPNPETHDFKSALMTFKQDIAGKQKQWATSNRRRNQPFYQGCSPELLISKWPNLYSGGSVCVLCHSASAFGCTMGSPSFGVSKTLTPEDNILYPRPVHRFLQGQPPLHCWDGVNERLGFSVFMQPVGPSWSTALVLFQNWKA